MTLYQTQIKRASNVPALELARLSAGLSWSRRSLRNNKMAVRFNPDIVNKYPTL